MSHATHKIKALVFFLLLLALQSADYSDVLLVVNSNSSNSTAIGNYFAANRLGLTHTLQVSLPGDASSLKFSELNSRLYSPIKDYLNSTNDTINYIVLSSNIPLYSNESEATVTPGCSFNADACQNSSSVDSEVALLNTAYASSVGRVGRISNPYYGSILPFSKARFGIYLVGRLDAGSTTVVQSMIDKATSFTKADLDSGLHIITGYSGIYSSEFGAANASLSTNGLSLYYNNSPTAQYPANAQGVSYFDTFGCYNFGGCNWGATQARNYTWKNGSLASSRYSWSARTTADYLNPYPLNGTLYYFNNYYVSSYLAQGATAGLGYAVEPLPNGVSNPAYLAKSYLAGRSLGEAAWSSIPQLSWAAVFFGDPKASYPTAIPTSTPNFPTNATNVTCNISISYLASPAHSYDLRHEWYKNGVNQPLLGGYTKNVFAGQVIIKTLPSNYLQVGDVWSCKSYLLENGNPVFSANSSVNITSSSICPTIASPGAVVLDSNHSSFSSCITILSDNVQLDCQGHSITGSNAPSSYGIFSNRTNTTIKNCAISNFYYGIFFKGAKNGFIDNTTIFTTSTYASPASILLQGSNNISINATNIASSYYALRSLGGSTISVSNSAFSTTSGAIFGMPSALEIESNSTVSNVLASGVIRAVLVNGGNNHLSGVRAFCSHGNAIYLSGSNNAINESLFSGENSAVVDGNENTIGNSNFTSDSNPAIDIQGSYNTLATSSASSNSQQALLLGGSYNNISNSNSLSNSSHAVYLKSGAAFNSFTNDNITSDSNISLYLEDGSGNNAFLQNTFTGTGWVSNFGSDNIFNGSSKGNAYYLANGTASWLLYESIDSNHDNYSDYGRNVPFGPTTLNASHWSGAGQDFHPFTQDFCHGRGVCWIGQTRYADPPESIGPD